MKSLCSNESVFCAMTESEAFVISPVTTCPAVNTDNSGVTVHRQRHLGGHPVAWHRRCKIMSRQRIWSFWTVQRGEHSSCSKLVNRTWDRNLARSVVARDLAMVNGTWETTDGHCVIAHWGQNSG